MPEPEFINASDAYRIYTARGGGMSYPTFLKLIQVNKLGIQPTGAPAGSVGGSYSIGLPSSLTVNPEAVPCKRFLDIILKRIALRFLFF